MNYKSADFSEILYPSDVFSITGLLLKNKRLIIGAVSLVGILVTIVLLLMPNQYRSHATILPSGQTDNLSGLKEVSAGLGFMIPSSEGSSDLYPNILRSNLVLDAVLSKQYEVQNSQRLQTMTLPDYFGRENHDKLRETLNAVTVVSTDRKTGVITVAVETEYPELSQAVVRAYLDELERFNLHKRRSRAKENAVYLDRQIVDLKRQLQAVEDSLEQFQKFNRDWVATSDPEIVKALTRLQREVEIKSQTYLFLTQEYEVAKLDAQKDVPIVRILDEPSLPAVKSGPKRLVTLLISLVFTFGLTVGVVFITEALRRRSHGPNREAFVALRADFERTFPRILRLVTHRRERETVDV